MNAQKHPGLIMQRLNDQYSSVITLTLSTCVYLSVMLIQPSCDDAPETIMQDTVENELVGLMERHKAAASWSDIIPNRGGGFFTTVYSVDLEYALDAHPDTAILFIVELNDICRTDSGYTACFSSHGVIWGGFPGDLRLHCREDLKEYLLSFTNHYLSDGFAVIAKVSSFSRPRFKVDISIDEEVPEESEVSIEASNQFVLHGELVEALYVRFVSRLMRYELSRRESLMELQPDN